MGKNRIFFARWTPAIYWSLVSKPVSQDIQSICYCLHTGTFRLDTRDLLVAGVPISISSKYLYLALKSTHPCFWFLDIKVKISKVVTSMQLYFDLMKDAMALVTVMAQRTSFRLKYPSKYHLPKMLYIPLPPTTTISFARNVLVCPRFVEMTLGVLVKFHTVHYELKYAVSITTQS